MTDTTDTRPRAALNGRVVDLDQLSRELGTGLVASDTDVAVADPDSTVTTAALKAAIDAHVPALDEPVPTLAELAAEVRGMKQRAAAEAAKSTTTAKGVASAIAADGA